MLIYQYWYNYQYNKINQLNITKSEICLLKVSLYKNGLAMYSKMQYKLLLVISPHPVTKTAIVPQNSLYASIKERSKNATKHFLYCMPDGYWGCLVASGLEDAITHQPWWCELLYFSTSVTGDGSLVLLISGYLAVVLQGSGPTCWCYLIQH